MADHERGWWAESILIVVSILVAFAIDAWWQDRLDREEEQRILVSLRAEFQANVDDFPIYTNSHQRTADFGQELFDQLLRAGPGASAQVSDTRLFWLLGHNSTDPRRGALDAALQSGDIRFLRSQALRERLSGWPRVVLDATENEELLRKIWGPMFYTALHRRVDLGPLYATGEECLQDYSLGQCAVDPIDLPYDTELLGHLIAITGIAAEAARELRLLEEETRTIVALLDEEIARIR